MRYFVARDNGSVIRQKNAFEGTNAKIDNMITAFLAANAGWTATEVNLTTFNSTTVTLDAVPSRNQAAAKLLTGIGDDDKLMRAILLVILDEINVIRALPSLAQAPRTIAQLKTAIQGKLNAGTAD